jgi:hypothetical protein
MIIVRITHRQRVFEEITALKREAGRRSTCEILDDMGLIEKHSCGIGCRVKHCLEQMAASTADIGDRLEGREIIGRQNPSDLSVGFPRHSLIKDVAYFGMLLQVCPSPSGRDQLRGRAARTHGVL